MADNSLSSKKLLSPADIAKELGLSKSVCRKMLKQGIFGRSIKLANTSRRQHFRVSAEDFMTYLQQIRPLTEPTLENF